MVIVRLISLLFVVGALMVLGADVLTFLETDAFFPRTLIGVLTAINAGAGDSVQDFANGLPDLLAGLFNAFLHAWAFVAIGLPGVLLAFFGLRSR